MLEPVNATIKRGSSFILILGIAASVVADIQSMSDINNTYISKVTVLDRTLKPSSQYTTLYENHQDGVHSWFQVDATDDPTPTDRVNYPSFEFATSSDITGFYTSIGIENILTTVSLSGNNNVVVQRIYPSQVDTLYLSFLWPLNPDAYQVMSGGECVLLSWQQDTLKCILNPAENVLVIKTSVPLHMPEGLFLSGNTAYPPDLAYSIFGDFFPPDDGDAGNDNANNLSPALSPLFLIVQSKKVGPQHIPDSDLTAPVSFILEKQLQMGLSQNDLLSFASVKESLYNPPPSLKKTGLGDTGTGSGYRFIEVYMMSMGGGKKPPNPHGQEPLQRQNQFRSRAYFTPHQRTELEAAFAKTTIAYPLIREELARRLNISEFRVQTWFQNRRAKLRRQQKATSQGTERSEAVTVTPVTSIPALVVSIPVTSSNPSGVTNTVSPTQGHISINTPPGSPPAYPGNNAARTTTALIPVATMRPPPQRGIPHYYPDRLPPLPVNTGSHEHSPLTLPGLRLQQRQLSYPRTDVALPLTPQPRFPAPPQQHASQGTERSEAVTVAPVTSIPALVVSIPVTSSNPSGATNTVSLTQGHTSINTPPGPPPAYPGNAARTTTALIPVATMRPPPQRGIPHYYPGRPLPLPVNTGPHGHSPLTLPGLRLQQRQLSHPRTAVALPLTPQPRFPAPPQQYAAAGFTSGHFLPRFGQPPQVMILPGAAPVLTPYQPLSATTRTASGSHQYQVVTFRRSYPHPSGNKTIVDVDRPGSESGSNN